MEKNNKNSKIVFIAAIIVVVVCALIIGIKLYNDNKSDKFNEKLQSIAQTQEVQTHTEAALQTEVEKGPADNPINFDELFNINKDIIGWIRINDTQIDYPVARYPEENQSYYLHNSIYGESSAYGTIYIERKNSSDFSDRVTVMYGHNMNNGSMFNNLNMFSDKQFFNDHQYINLYTPGHILTYEVISAFEYDDRHILNSFDFSKDSVFKEYLDMILAPHSLVQNVREGVTLSLDDKILVLSTCVNTNDKARYLVQTRLVSDEVTR